MEDLQYSIFRAFCKEPVSTDKLKCRQEGGNMKKQQSLEARRIYMSTNT